MVAAGGRQLLDVLTPVAGVSMVVRAVRAVLAAGLVDRVLLDGGVRSGQLVAACAGLPVDLWSPELLRVGAHVRQRVGAAAGDAGVADRIVVVHDAARPLAPPTLFTAVVEAVREQHDIAVAVLPLTDTVKVVDTDGVVVDTPDRATLRVVQTPLAFRAGSLGIHIGLLDGGGLLGALAGRPAHAVPGDPLAFAIHTPWDLQLAELLVRESG